MAVEELAQQVEQMKLDQQDVIVEGPSSEGKKFNEKKLKKVVKEGGKRGVEIEGAADMGGLQFFCTQLLEPEGNLDLLVESMKAMNAKSDPSEEERKGGAGKLGKIIISSTETKLAAVAYVPKHQSDKCNATEWLNFVVERALGSKKAVEAAATIASCEGVDSANYATVEIKNSPDDNVFVLKFRDTLISHAYAFLKPKGLFPEDDDEDDEDFCFGDEDFPQAGDEEAVEDYDLLCPIAERLTSDKLEKKMKKITKEGGKRGVEIEGAADMGGLQFFCTQMELPEGDVDCLVESMRSMNQKSDPSEEERKGGAGHIGKTIMSFNDSRLCLVAYVPKEKSAECNASEWLLNTINKVFEAQGKDIPADLAASCISSHPGNEATFAKAVVEKNADKGLFPLKMKDDCVTKAYDFLKAKGLFPDGNDDEDDDDYVFGDEDFPE